MATLTKEMESKANGSIAALTEKGEGFGQTIEKLSHNLGQNMGAAVGEVTEKATSYVKTTRDYVEKNPMRSVAVAAATGLALGTLLTLASRRKH